jgi:hypothetical protein
VKCVGISSAFQSVLLDANLQITGLVSNLLGRTGRAVLNALVAGQTDPEHLADLCKRLKAPRAALVEALRGHVTVHHHKMIAMHLRLIDGLHQGEEGVKSPSTNSLPARLNDVRGHDLVCRAF